MMSLTRRELVDMLGKLEDFTVASCDCTPDPVVLIDNYAAWTVTTHHGEDCTFLAEALADGPGQLVHEVTSR